MRSFDFTNGHSWLRMAVVHLRQLSNRQVVLVVPSRTAVSLVSDLGQLHLTSRMLIFVSNPSPAVR